MHNKSISYEFVVSVDVPHMIRSISKINST